MKRKYAIFVTLAVIAAIAFSWRWFEKASRAVVGTGERWSSESTYFFADRRDADWEFLYAIRGNEVVVQKAVFPGFKSRQWYHHKVDSDRMMSDLKAWAVRPGELDPPFLPDEMHPCRISLSEDETRPRGEAWFEDDSTAVKMWFATLQREFMKPEYRIEKLPLWVSEDARVRKYFGFWE